MQTRRNFIKSAGLLSSGLFLAPDLLAFDKKYIGLQLYTVRDQMTKNPAATLERVARIGYTSVEGTYSGVGKFHGVPVKEFKGLLKQNGLIMPSGHYRLGEEKIEGKQQEGTILSGWGKAVDEASMIGLKYMVCAYLSIPERGNLDHYKKVAADLNVAGERCRKSGIQLCYHNHDFEFKEQDGKLPYEILLGSTDKNLVKMEMDMYWVSKAGQDPVALLNQHPGRFPLWHLKDMDKTPERAFTEVGNGTIDFKRIFKHAKKAGLKYFFVEEDKTPGDPFDSIETSIKYVKSHLI